MTEVRLETEGRTLKAVTPFHADFVKGARKLAGKWRGGVWIFPASQEDRVRDLCRKVYGTDGEPCEAVTLRVEFPEAVQARQDSIFVAGRMVARATGRDSGARPGPGVVLLEGGVESGGSRTNWATVIRAGTVVEILDLPRQAAETAIAQDSGGSVRTIVEGTRPAGPGKAPVRLADTTALEAERARLLERLEAIDDLLAAARRSGRNAPPVPGAEASSGMEP